MSPDDKNLRLLKDLADRLREDQGYMAYVLAIYKRRHRLNDESLGRRLKALPEMIVRLALCRRPEENSMNFDDQVREISDYTLIEESLLKEIISKAREEKAIHQVKSARSRLAIMLSAVRERSFSIVRKYGSALALVAIAIAICGAGIYLWLRGDGSPVPRPVVTESEKRDGSPETAKVQANTSEKTEPPVPSSAPVQKAPAGTPRAPALIRIDLERFSVLRGPEGEDAQGQPIRMLPARNHILFTLSEGGAPGQYRVSVVDAFGETLITEEATSTTGERLKVALDMRGLAEKKYRMCITREEEIPDCFPVVISKSSKHRSKL